MPANLPPEYHEIEKELRTAKTPREKIDIYERLIAVIPHHKGTDKLIAMYRQKIAKAKEELEWRPAATRHAQIFMVEKQGAGQIVLVGPPNSGKSLLVKRLTGASPEVGDYPFTTKKPAPYMMPFENVMVQLVDTPPVSQDFMESWFPELVKMADAVALVIDLSDTNAAGTATGIIERLRQKRIELVRGGAEIPPDRFNVLKRSLAIANKFDGPDAGHRLEDLKSLPGLPGEIVAVSAANGQGLAELRRTLFELLYVVRVYSKIPGKKPDLNSPFTLPRGSTVMDMARVVHKDFAEKLAYARVWNSNGLDGLRVTRGYLISDCDIVELHI